MKKFWMVYGLAKGAPAVRHDKPEEALAQAKRLCLREGGTFVVLEAMACAEPAEPKVTACRPK